jgi:hypothetical protein
MGGWEWESDCGLRHVWGRFSDWGIGGWRTILQGMVGKDATFSNALRALC